MKAPEKIYVHVRHKPCEITFSEVKEEGVSNIEYTRTEAFIEKACEWLEDNLYDYAGMDDKRNIVPFDKSIFKDFKNYMKGDKL